jgi:hypothetical protein
MVRGGDFTRALEHARRQIELFKTLSATNPSYKGRLKSNRILLAAMSLVRESQLEGLIIERVNNEDLFESVRSEGIPELIEERRTMDRREDDRRSSDRRMADRGSSS